MVRTIVLLEFLNDAKLREQITATTNKVEAYNGFAKWLKFGGEGVIDTVDAVEQEKHLKYNHLVANAAVIQNVIDLIRAVRDLQADGSSFAVRILSNSAPTRRDDSSASAITPSRWGHPTRSRLTWSCPFRLKRRHSRQQRRETPRIKR